jgi:hypothetical protein
VSELLQLRYETAVSCPEPGIVNSGEDGKVFSKIDLSRQVSLAVVTIVPVKAKADNGVTNPGDLLVVSDMASHTMKAEYFPGVVTVISKALTRLDSGARLIQMLVMIQ